MVAALIVLVAAVILVRSQIDPERLRERIVKELRAALGFPVEVGSVSLSLFSGSIDLHDVRVVASDAATAESAPLLLTEATVEFRPLSLLSRPVEVTRVTLKNPRIALERRSDGTWNVSALASSGSEAVPVQLPSIHLRGAIIGIRDDELFAPGSSQVFRDIDFALEPMASGPYHVEGFMNDPSWGDLAVRGRLSRALDDIQLSVARRDLTLGPDLRARFSGDVQAVWDEILPSGAIDVDVNLRVSREGVAYRLAVDCKGIDLRFREFPYPIREVFGRIEVDNDSIVMRELRGSAGAAVIRVDGQVRRYTTERPEIHARLEAAGLAFDAALKRALQERYLKYWEAFRPAGRANIRCNLDRGASDPDLSVTASVELLDAELTYIGVYNEEEGRPTGFPYTVEKIHGRIDAAPGKTSFDLTGAIGGATFGIKGTAIGPGAYPEIRVNVAGRRVPLDDKLRQALDPPAREAWDRFHPAGVANVDALVVQPAGPRQKTRTDVQVEFLDGAFTFDDFPYPLEKLTGHLSIQGSLVEASGMVGRHGPAEVRIDARVEGPGKDAARLIRIDAKDVLLDSSFKHAIGVAKPAIAELWDQLAASGTADFHYEERREDGPEKPVHTRGSARFSHSAIRYKGFPYPVSEIEGSIQFENNVVTIELLRGAPIAGGRVSVTGEVRESGESSALTLDIAAEDLTVDSTFVEAVKTGRMAELAPVVEELRPQGAMDLEYHYEEKSGAPSGSRLVVRPRGLRIESQYLPVPITDLVGEISLEGSVLRARDLDGRVGVGSLHVSQGMADLSEGVSRLELEVDAVDLPIDDRCYTAIPGTLGEALARLGASGTLDLSQLRVDAEREEDRWHVEFRGTLGLDSFRISPGIGIENMKGTIILSEADIFGSAFRFDADVSGMDITILGRKIEGISARVIGRPTYFWAYRVGGDFYGGQIVPRESFVQIQIGESTRYRGKLEVLEVDAERLANEVFSRGAEVTGTARATVEFDGAGPGIGNLAGSGELRVRNGRLMRLPLIDPLLRLLSVKNPPAFTDADFEFTIRDGMLDFQRFDLSSAPLSLEGTGTLDVDGTLDLLFKATIAPGIELFFIDWVFDWLKGQLFAIRVYGSIENPQSALTNFLFRLAGERARPRKEPKDPPFRISPIPDRF